MIPEIDIKIGSIRYLRLISAISSDLGNPDHGSGFCEASELRNLARARSLQISLHRNNKNISIV
jgi:hypothetical protein